MTQEELTTEEQLLTEDLMTEEQRIADIKEIITALNFCETKDKHCKKCKEKDGCLKFIRSSVALSLQLFLTNLEVSEEYVPEYFV